jgi:hypothetical protein
MFEWKIDSRECDSETSRKILANPERSVTLKIGNHRFGVNQV